MTTRMQAVYKTTNGSCILLCIYLFTFPHFGVLFDLNTESFQDIQISSLNELLSRPLSCHLCNKFSSSVDLAINSEPWVLPKPHPSVPFLLKLSFCSLLLSQVVFVLLLWDSTLLKWPTHCKENVENSLLWQSGHDLMTFCCPWSERCHSPSFTYVRYLVV